MKRDFDDATYGEHLFEFRRNDCSRLKTPMWWFDQVKMVGWISREWLFIYAAAGLSAIISKHLRPEVMLISYDGSLGSELQKTSGICVKSSSGKWYVICASHGFSGGKGQSVFHPSTGDELIEKFAKQFWNSDVGLLKLNSEFGCGRETFSTFEYLAQSFKKRELIDVHLLFLHVHSLLPICTSLTFYMYTLSYMI